MRTRKVGLKSSGSKTASVRDCSLSSVTAWSSKGDRVSMRRFCSVQKEVKGYFDRETIKSISRIYSTLEMKKNDSKMYTKIKNYRRNLKIK